MKVKMTAADTINNFRGSSAIPGALETKANTSATDQEVFDHGEVRKNARLLVYESG